jgi:hypothetical protein
MAFDQSDPSGGFMNRLSIFAFLLIGTVTQSANAQLQNPVQYHFYQQMHSMQQFQKMAGNAMVDKMRKDALAKKSGKQSSGSDTETVRPAKIYPTTYKEAAANSIASKYRESDESSAAALDAMIADYKKDALREGYEANDLAFAMQYYVINNFNIYNNLVEMPADLDPDVRKAKDRFDRILVLQNKQSYRVSPYGEKLVYQQFKAAIQSDPGMGALSDADKQQFTEALAIMTLFSFTSYNVAIVKKDDDGIDEARDIARQSLEQMFNMPVDKIHISSLGGLGLY